MGVYGDTQVYLNIREELLRDNVHSASGRRLNVKHFQYSHNVSLIPVREALIRLAQQDIIDLKANQGYFTKGRCVDELFEALTMVGQYVKENSALKTINRHNMAPKTAELFFRSRAQIVTGDGTVWKKQEALIECFEYLIRPNAGAMRQRVVSMLLDTLRRALVAVFEDKAFCLLSNERLESVADAVSNCDVHQIETDIDHLIDAIGNHLLQKATGRCSKPGINSTFWSV